MIQRVTVTDLDIADFFETAEDLANFLNVVLEEGYSESTFQISVLETVMRAARIRGLLDGLALDVDFQIDPITAAFAMMRALDLRFKIEQLTEANSDLST